MNTQQNLDAIDAARRKQAVWTCPRCGGCYFGLDLSTDIIACHCNTDGNRLPCIMDYADDPDGYRNANFERCGWTSKDATP